MGSKLDPADETQISAQGVDKKDLLDPATQATIIGAAWFAAQAAAQGIIGFIAVRLFEPIWAWWTSKKEKSEECTGLSEEEQESQT